MIFILLLFSFNLYAQKLEVIKPEFNDKIELIIIRAKPDEFSRYTLTHINSRNMDLTCKGRILRGEEEHAHLLYRNFYNEPVAHFKIDDNRACAQLGRFIETVHYGIDEENPLRIILSRKHKKVVKIIYPNLDPYADHGDVMDLFKKPPVLIKLPNEQGREIRPEVTINKY